GFHVRGPLPFQLRPRRHRLLGPHPPRRRRTLVRRRLGQATHFLFPRHLRPLPPCRLRLRPRRTPARRPRLGHTPAHPPMVDRHARPHPTRRRPHPRHAAPHRARRRLPPPSRRRPRRRDRCRKPPQGRRRLRAALPRQRLS